MRSMQLTPPAKNWLIAVAYVLSIYATIGYVRTPLIFLREQGLLLFSLYATYGAVFVYLVAFLVIKKRLEWWRFPGILLVFFGYLYLSKSFSAPEEQIHFLQYGLVGVLFLKALKPTGKITLTAYLVAVGLASLAGWLDEILQGIHPSRVYDRRDIFLNLISAILGLVLYKFLALQEKQKPKETQCTPALCNLHRNTHTDP